MFIEQPTNIYCISLFVCLPILLPLNVALFAHLKNGNKSDDTRFG